MCPLVREVAKDVKQALAERFAQAGHHVPKAPAVGAKKVGIGDHRHDVRLAAAAHVIASAIDRASQSQVA
jgi:hypothetical protein